MRENNKNGIKLTFLFPESLSFIELFCKKIALMSVVWVYESLYLCVFVCVLVKLQGDGPIRSRFWQGRNRHLGFSPFVSSFISAEDV